MSVKSCGTLCQTHSKTLLCLCLLFRKSENFSSVLLLINTSTSSVLEVIRMIVHYINLSLYYYLLLFGDYHRSLFVLCWAVENC